MDPIFIGKIIQNNQLLYQHPLYGKDEHDIVKNHLSLAYLHKNKKLTYDDDIGEQITKLINKICGNCQSHALSTILSKKIKTRFDIHFLVIDKLRNYIDKQYGKQCFTDDTAIQIGKGSFGKVYKIDIGGTPIVYKTTTVRGKNTGVNTFWEEINLLIPYINDMIINYFTQNLPYTYCSLLCDNKLSYFTEFADGTLREWFSYNPTIEQQYSCIFQILSALHTVQSKLQLHHADIKDLNILFKKCKSGGYWKYVIDGDEYYVPNLGYIFYLNDFGVSKSYNYNLDICTKNRTYYSGKIYKFTKYKTISHRPYLIDDGIAKPIQYDIKNQPRCSWCKVVGDKMIPIILYLDKEFYYVSGDSGITRLPQLSGTYTLEYLCQRPLICPPIEFIKDIQDVVRMVIGGIRRTTQPGEHNVLDFSKSIKDSFAKYIIDNYYFIGRVLLENINAYLLCAKYLIRDIFKDMYTCKKTKVLDTFIS